jgi:hypothetical protein
MARYDFTGVANIDTGFGQDTLGEKPLAKVAGAPGGIERRKASRPWANRTNKSQPAAAPRPEAAAASTTRAPARAESGANSNEWQEF